MCNEKTQGAIVIFDNVIKPILIKFEGHIDGQLDNFNKKIDGALNEAKPLIDQVQKAAHM